MNVRLVILVFVFVFKISTANWKPIISREEWNARDSKDPMTPLAINPAPYVIIHHSASPPCFTEEACKSRVKAFQNYHMDHNGWNDIGYTFVVGEDGNVYEGRGWGTSGAHAPKFNDKSIGICVIGNFESALPNNAALNAVKNLIAYGTAMEYISPDYTLLGHRQVRATSCPGGALYSEITTWNHWSSTP